MNAFSLAVFVGAFLLFLVQPMMGKFILPWFGGGTAVWSACLLFFQVGLLAGYGYAHGSARWWRPRTQALAQSALALGALLWLPAIPNPRWQPDAATEPTWGILWLLALTVGLPYLVLATTGPLMQHWFSLARPGASPYRLYALSNAGSLAALAAYPFLLEPLLTRQTQAWVWSAGMGLYAALTLACAVKLWRAQPADHAGASPGGCGEGEATTTPSRGIQALWVLLPACASALLLATTNKVCLDVMVMPFLWVLPLALYLLSFILSFAGVYSRRWQGAALIPPLALAAWVLYFPPKELPLQVPALLFALFCACLVCHGELYKLRPAPRHLTAFYLLIATGGALGGVFVAVIAPLLFNDYFELHWSLGMLPALLTVIHWREGGTVVVGGRRWPLWPLGALATVGFGLIWQAQPRFVNPEQVFAARNFYGVLKLRDLAPGTPHAALGLNCGTTLHGFQLRRPGLEDVPTGYFHERTGIGLVLGGPPRDTGRRIGIVGLGVGTLAVYGHTNDVMRFYEINPMARKLAEERFSFLARCRARTEIILGDARLSLEREPAQAYDVLVLDAFNSDSVPVHLLTREAFQVYRRHLKPDSVIAVHISSRHVNLVPVLERVAEEFHFTYAMVDWAPLREYRRGTSPIEPWQTFDARWFLLSQDPAALERAEIREQASPLLAGRTQVSLWTDDHTSLLPLLVW